MKQTEDSLFYCDVEENKITQELINGLRLYSSKNSKQVYIVKRALGTKKEYDYELTDIAIILIPKHTIKILNYGVPDDDALDDFESDLKEDVAYLSDKYDYKKILGRPRKWPSNFFHSQNLQDFNLEEYLKDEIQLEYQRKIDLLISLLIGSINSIEKIGLSEPRTLLEKVKQKIILFDGQQSRFIYQNLNQPTVKIQGMAGTGKTELLLHKLKDVYANEANSVIAFTCHNEVLAADMRRRIPDFFNFMKVEEQIEWNKRLHVFRSWGAMSNPESGLYSYICRKYDLPFKTYTQNHNFDQLCIECLEILNAREDVPPCFDYIFIDESQDFKEGFFHLCQKVTRKTVYIAGDIFQNIYDTSSNTAISPDFLLNKCYRTDPKTLMFAHAVGMGLYENPHLNWLDDRAWKSCGYCINRNTQQHTVQLSRKPLRRFEDLEATDTIQLFSCNNKYYVSEIIHCIDEIINENEGVEPGDIAIVILANYSALCEIADKVSYLLLDKYNWSASKGYETKEKVAGNVYISNTNNIKGLEFPFVICLSPGIISSNISKRNAIYMALTRSFLTSYFIIDERNTVFFKEYKKALSLISQNGYLEVHEPDEAEYKAIQHKIKISLENKKKSREEMIEELLVSRECSTLSDEQKQNVKILAYTISPCSESDFIKRVRVIIKNLL